MILVVIAVLTVVVDAVVIVFVRQEEQLQQPQVSRQPTSARGLGRCRRTGRKSKQS